MAALLHDPSAGDSIKRRVAALRPDSQRRWGTMTVDQMLWHVNTSLDVALGHTTIQPQKFPIPKPILKYLVINVPWRKGKTPTAPEFVARERYDFESERQRTLALIDEFLSRPLNGEWVRNATLGQLTGSEWSRLHHKHLDYHLQQFGA